MLPISLPSLPTLPTLPSLPKLPTLPTVNGNGNSNNNKSSILTSNHSISQRQQLHQLDNNSFANNDHADGRINIKNKSDNFIKSSSLMLPLTVSSMELSSSFSNMTENPNAGSNVNSIDRSIATVSSTSTSTSLATAAATASRSSISSSSNVIPVPIPIPILMDVESNQRSITYYSINPVDISKTIIQKPCVGWCAICKKSYSSGLEIDRCYLSHEWRMNCIIRSCTQTFTNPFERQQHFENDHSDHKANEYFDISCEQCALNNQIPKPGMTITEIKQHFQDHKTLRGSTSNLSCVECTKCNTRFVDIAEFTKHVSNGLCIITNDALWSRSPEELCNYPLLAEMRNSQLKYAYELYIRESYRNSNHLNQLNFSPSFFEKNGHSNKKNKCNRDHNNDDDNNNNNNKNNGGDKNDKDDKGEKDDNSSDDEDQENQKTKNKNKNKSKNKNRDQEKDRQSNQSNSSSSKSSSKSSRSSRSSKSTKSRSSRSSKSSQNSAATSKISKSTKTGRKTELISHFCFNCGRPFRRPSAVNRHEDKPDVKCNNPRIYDFTKPMNKKEFKRVKKQLRSLNINCDSLKSQDEILASNGEQAHALAELIEEHLKPLRHKTHKTKDSLWGKVAQIFIPNWSSSSSSSSSSLSSDNDNNSNNNNNNYDTNNGGDDCSSNSNSNSNVNSNSNNNGINGKRRNSSTNKSVQDLQRKRKRDQDQDQNREQHRQPDSESDREHDQDDDHDHDHDHDHDRDNDTNGNNRNKKKKHKSKKEKTKDDLPQLDERPHSLKHEIDDVNLTQLNLPLQSSLSHPANIAELEKILNL